MVSLIGVFGDFEYIFAYIGDNNHTYSGIVV